MNVYDLLNVPAVFALGFNHTTERIFFSLVYFHFFFLNWKEIHNFQLTM